jgi:hypothetical protein
MLTSQLGQCAETVAISTGVKDPGKRNPAERFSGN